jgi:chromosome segregation ATPase
MKAPALRVSTADLQEQLKPVAIDLALVRRGIEQLTSNLDQLARKQDQLAQNIATLQTAEQEVSQKVSAPPPTPKAVHVSPKPVQPPAQ